MDHLILRSLSPKNLKSEARACFPRVKSSHLTEAIAIGLGFRTQAALLSSERESHYHTLAQPFELKRFGRALIDFGVEPEVEFEHQSWSWQSAVLWEVLWDFALERESELERGGRFVLSVPSLDVVSKLSQLAGASVPDDLGEPELATEWLIAEMRVLSQGVIVVDGPDYSRRYRPVTESKILYDTNTLSVEFGAVVVERMSLHQMSDQQPVPLRST